MKENENVKEQSEVLPKPRRITPRAHYKQLFESTLKLCNRLQILSVVLGVLLIGSIIYVAVITHTTRTTLKAYQVYIESIGGAKAIAE